MINNARLYQPFRIMDKLCFNLVLLAFILIFLQKNAQGIKCLECYNCNHLGIAENSTYPGVAENSTYPGVAENSTHPGVAENSTCVTDGGYCVSTIVRKKGKDQDVILVTRGCMTKDLYLLCDVSVAKKYEQNISCCRDRDLCNIEVPELAPWPCKAVHERPIVSDDTLSYIVGVIIGMSIFFHIFTLIFFHTKVFNNWKIRVAADNTRISEKNQLPHFDLVPSDPSLKDMMKVVSGDKQQLSIPNTWQNTKSLWLKTQMMMECWSRNVAARLTESAVRNTLARLAEQEEV